MLGAAIAEGQTVPIEDTIIWIVQWLKLGIKTIGAALVALGIVVAIGQLLRQFAARQTADFTCHSPRPRALSCSRP